MGKLKDMLIDEQCFDDCDSGYHPQSDYCMLGYMRDHVAHVNEWLEWRRPKKDQIEEEEIPF